MNIPHIKATFCFLFWETTQHRVQSWFATTCCFFFSFCKAVFFEKRVALAFDAFACLVRLFVWFGWLVLYCCIVVCCALFIVLSEH